MYNFDSYYELPDAPVVFTYCVRDNYETEDRGAACEYATGTGADTIAIFDGEGAHLGDINRVDAGWDWGWEYSFLPDVSAATIREVKRLNPDWL